MSYSIFHQAQLAWDLAEDPAVEPDYDRPENESFYVVDCPVGFTSLPDADIQLDALVSEGPFTMEVARRVAAKMNADNDDPEITYVVVRNDSAADDEFDRYMDARSKECADD